MARRLRHSETAGASLRRSAFQVSAAAGLLALLATGCQTFQKAKPAATSAPKPPEALGPTGATTTKTDFQHDASPSQQYNVHLELGRMYETQGNLEAAVAEYAKAAEVPTKHGGAFLADRSKLGPAAEALAQRRMAAALDRLGRFTQAETHYNQALKLAPRDSKVWNDVGYSYYLQARYPDAERALKTADAYDSNNPKTLTNLGLVLAAEGKNDEALAALTRSGGPAVGHANLGFIFAAMGKKDEACHEYKEALALEPHLNAARTALAKLDPNAAAAVPATAIAAQPVAAPPALATVPLTVPTPLPLSPSPTDPQVALTSATETTNLAPEAHPAAMVPIPVPEPIAVPQSIPEPEPIAMPPAPSRTMPETQP